ncbi:uncharacterized protein [Montipora foliosa]|uniref:uncharacterized protein n=1 Tax=Montipora foliosa TaxID=591990 RepID=UPI0035F129CF
MAEKQGNSACHETRSCSPRFPHLVSFISALICITVLVRVEIVNKRVDTIENLFAEVRIPKTDRERSEKRIEKRDTAAFGLGRKERDSHLRDAETDKTEKLRARRLIKSSPETDSHKFIVDAVKSEINKTLTSLTPKAFCSTKEQICVQGPPGMPGLKGSRGKRGPRGNTGRKGSRGPIGNPGPHGKLGISGPPGQKGTQGGRGIQGPRGFPGAKGEPGKSISTPTIVISPITQTVRENQNAVFQCSATGNPKPRVTWLRSDRSWTHRFRYQSDGKLEGCHVTLGDAGKYTCVAENLLGSMNKSAILTVEAAPRVQLVPGPTHAKTSQNVTLPRCRVTGFPVPVVTWRKLSGVLSRQRAVYGKGSLTVVGAMEIDTGPYQCKAKNDLGEASAVTTLVVWPPPKFITKPPRAVTKLTNETLLTNCYATAQASISWRRVGGAWEGGRMKVKNGSLEISSLEKTDSGSYICEAKLLFYTISTTMTLKVEDPLNFTTNGRKGRYGIIQKFSIPNSGRYKIKAWGARGGTHSYNYGDNPGTYYGGKGAFKEGTFTLSKGTVLNIVVGQKGGDSVEVKGGRSTGRTAAELGLSVEDNAGTGGGGGSFVYTTSNVLLLAAGGGGGASGGYNGVDGQTGTSGASSVGKETSQSRMGGTGGQPGQCNSASASFHGGVGAGWLAQGCARAGESHGERGGSRAQGWVGGRAGAMNSGKNGGPPPGAVGGFGGGGGGSEDNGASGGGGGYSGGGSGTHKMQAGGGGGSFCSGASCSGTSGLNSNEDGMVQIFELSH